MATAQLTNAGRNLYAGVALGNTGATANGAVTWIAIGTGTGLLATSLTNGTAYTTLTLSMGSTTAIANGTSLTIVNGANTQAVTLSSAVAMGDTVLNVTSFNANHSYAIGSGVLTTPAATDTQLQNEVFRKALSSSAAGGSPGEVLLILYIAPTDYASATFLEIGWYAGAADSGTNDGTLIARAIYWYPHVYNQDSADAQLDTIF